MFCKYCGAVIDNDSTFCASCGKSLTEGKTESKENATGSKSGKIASADTQTKWYYQDASETKGPFSYDIFAYKVRNHEIGRYSSIRQEGSSEWISIQNSPFGDLLKTHTNTSVSFTDIWVWCLAIVPILVKIAIQHFSLLPNNSPISWLIVIGLNILFIILDRRVLQGYADDWLYIGCVVVPAYLIVREIKTNLNFCPAVIWTFLFAVSIFIVI